MITSKQILQVSEERVTDYSGVDIYKNFHRGRITRLCESLAHPQDEKEILLTSSYIIDNWVQGSGSKSLVNIQGMSQANLQFLVRNIPKSRYSGKAYRLLWINAWDLVKQKIIPKLDFATDVTGSQIKKVLSANKSYLSKMASWTKSLAGVVASEKTLSQNRIGSNILLIILSDNIVGIDVKSVVDWILDTYPKYFTLDTAPSSLQHLMNQGGGPGRWSQSEFEIIAPFNISTVTVESISWSKQSSNRIYGQVTKRKPLVIYDQTNWDGTITLEFGSKEGYLLAFDRLSNNKGLNSLVKIRKSNPKLQVFLFRDDENDKTINAKIEKIVIPLLSQLGFFISKEHRY